jgi:amino acid transporter/mannitol/fructose-specific phosphotransferase system IIA component (Ntr-type)/nucleotide-binding universal stress UspA family protein
VEGHLSVKRPLGKQLDRKLGLPSVVAISTGAMLSGIFVLPGLAGAMAGPWVWLSFLVGGLLVLPAVLSKTELATAMPVAGGIYVYVDRAMGPWMGTVAGLGAWLALSAKIAFTLVGLGAYLALFWDASGQPVSLIVLAGLLAVNALGVSKASGLQIAVVASTVGALVLFTGKGLTTVDAALLRPAFPQGLSGILAGAGFLFVSYGGVTKVASVAEEIRDPSRNIPLGMLLSLALVLVLYCLLALVLMGNVDHREMVTDVTPLATAAEVVLGPSGRTAMAVVAVVGLISMCNAGVLATSRFPFAMGRDGLLPSEFRQVSARFGTPLVAIGVTGLLLVLLVTSLPVVKLAKLASGFKIFLFILVNLVVVVLRESGARWYRPTFRTPLYPWVQGVGIVGGLVILISLGTFALLGLLLAVAGSSLWYLVYGRSRADRSSAFRHLWGETRALRVTEQAERASRANLEPRVIVPIFGGETATERLLYLGGAFVTGGSLQVLRVEEVAEQLSLASQLEADPAGSTVISESERLAAELHLKVGYQHVVTHNAQHALAEHARTEGAQWIVMEWPERRGIHHLIPHPSAWWLDHPPCDLALFVDRTPPGEAVGADLFSSILVVAEPGPYDSLLVHVADRLAQHSGGSLTLFLPVAESTDPSMVRQQRGYHRQLMQLCQSQARSVVVPTGHPYATVTELTQHFDLMVIGSPAEGGLRRLFVASHEHRLAKAARCSVLRLKAPRHSVHARLVDAPWVPVVPFTLRAFLRTGALVAGLPATTKAELFARMAAQLSEHITGVGDPMGAARIEAALAERERIQNTGLASGVSLSAPTLASLEEPILGVFSLRRAIDFEPPAQRGVDVCVVALAPPEHRQIQLRILERMSRMLLQTELLEGLRGARDEGDILKAILEAEERLVDR